VDQDQIPHRSRHLLKLPPHLEALPKFPSKRYKDNKHGTYISTYQTCDYLILSTESSLNVTKSPSTPISSLISGTPSTLLASTVGVSEIPALTATQPMGST
jgi:hypothetical protein